MSEPMTIAARRRAANATAREARRRLYAAITTLDATIRLCAHRFTAAEASERTEIVAELERAIGPYVAAAERLPDADADT